MELKDTSSVAMEVAGAQGTYEEHPEITLDECLQRHLKELDITFQDFRSQIYAISEGSKGPNESQTPDDMDLPKRRERQMIRLVPDGWSLMHAPSREQRPCQTISSSR